MFVKKDEFAKYQNSRGTSMMQSRRIGRDGSESLSSSHKTSLSRDSSVKVRRKNSNCQAMTFKEVQECRVISTISEEALATAEC